jgi:hypothetical protein
MILIYDGESPYLNYRLDISCADTENWADEIDDHQTAFLTAFNARKRI